jgi:hypothetical protein
LCDSSDLVCGSCIKEFTSTESFTNAEANCVNLTEFQHLHIIKNKAQWFYDINKTMNEPHWVKHNLKRNNFYYISFKLMFSFKIGLSFNSQPVWVDGSLYSALPMR